MNITKYTLFQILRATLVFLIFPVNLKVGNPDILLLQASLITFF